MGVEDKLKEIDKHIEEMRVDESIVALYRLYQEYKNIIEEKIESCKNDKNVEGMESLVKSLEEITNKISKEVKKERKKEKGFTYEMYENFRKQGKTDEDILDITKEQFGIEKKGEIRSYMGVYARKQKKIERGRKLAQVNYDLYESLSSQGKTYEEIKEILKGEYGFTDGRKISGWYKTYRKNLERKKSESKIEQFYIKRINEGKFTPEDFISLTKYHNVHKGDIKHFFKIYKNTHYNTISKSAGQRFSSLVEQAKRYGKPVEFKNSIGTRFIDIGGGVHSTLEEAIEAIKSYQER